MPRDEDSGWRVIRDAVGTIHLPDGGLPACGYDGDGLVDAIHPSDHAAIWCTNCLQKVAGLRSA